MANIVPIHAPKVGIFLVMSQINNNIIIGLVEESVATIPASAFWSAMSKRLIPKAIPKKPLIIDWPIIFKVKVVLGFKI